ncbi:hypothetical protein LH29_01860 [Draconibacterium sediminis]|uniref:Uncharacterized protein n=1 Tax=Draconibacterium sediminis TaxID=1544798 RepID=A0A0D8JC46_9BACT|nr:hypothetical protein LH29_01860 [Draconibacterium sediminis]
MKPKKILQIPEERLSKSSNNQKQKRYTRSLPENFKGTGEVKPYYFSLVQKTDRGFCYEVTLNGIVTHYETFRRKINKRFGCISYPGSSSFGIWAWTFQSRNAAIAKLQTL